MLRKSVFNDDRSMNAFGFRGCWGKSYFVENRQLESNSTIPGFTTKARNWYASAKWLPNFVELLLGNSQIHSLFYSSWQIFSFFCTTKFLYLKAHISVVYLKNVIFPVKTAAALPKIWWSNCSTYGYGEIEHYYEYCHPKANKKGQKNRTVHFAWLRSGQRGRLLSRNIVNRTKFHYFHEYFCSGTNFQSIFLLFDMLVISRCPWRGYKPLFVASLCTVIYHRICFALF